MGKIRARKKSGNLLFDFRYKGKRCREQTVLSDTPSNRNRLVKILKKIEAEITLGSFQYADYFPESSKVRFFAQNNLIQSHTETPKFTSFAELWLAEMKIQWRKTQYKNVITVLKK